jgi:hypothetical protein
MGLDSATFWLVVPQSIMLPGVPYSYRQRIYLVKQRLSKLSFLRYSIATKSAHHWAHKFSFDAHNQFPKAKLYYIPTTAVPPISQHVFS